MRLPLPTRRTYGVWVFSQTQPPPAPAEVVLPVTMADLRMIERSRPGYSPLAQAYLTQDHRGVMIQREGSIIAMAWSVGNSEQRTLRTKGYYPLRPGRTLLHADWVHPDHRGEGLHRVLIAARLASLTSGTRGMTIETNIEPGNVASVRNYESQGFLLDRRLTVMAWGPWAIARHHG